MSAYQNVVEGKLRLKGKPLRVFKAKAEADAVSRNKRKQHKHRSASHSQGENTRLSTNPTDSHEAENGSSEANGFENHLTAAERAFLHQTHKLELQRLAKIASKSHRDRIQEFNQYLANLTEHYDIPKVGPG